MRVILLVLAVVLALPADAQRRRAQPFAERGDVALVVTLDGLDAVRLRPALGGIGVRYRVADQTVVGTSLGLSVLRADTETDADGSGRADRQQRGEDAVDATVSVWVEQHVGRRRRAVSPFVGAGVQVGIGSAESDTEQMFLPCEGPTECAPVTRVFESERQTLQVAGGVFVGAEVRLAAGVTLGGAYTFGVRYTDTEESRRSVTEGAPEEQSFDRQFLEIGTGTTGLSLSVYF